MRSARALLGLAVLALVTCALAMPRACLAETSTLAEYRSRVSEAADVAEAALPDIAEKSVAHQAAAEVNGLLPSVETVLVDGREIRVDNSVLRSIVARLDAARGAGGRREAGERMGQHLASLERALEPAPDVPSDPEALRKLLGDQRAAVRRSMAETLARLAERLQRWLADRLGDFRAAPGNVQNIALLATIGALLSILAFATSAVVRGVRRGIAARERGVPLGEPVAAIVAAAEGLPADALAHADMLAGESRFREALRALFGGAARALVERGLVRQSRTRTNSELLAEASVDAPDAVPPLGALSAAFERSWYGHLDPGSEGYAEARERYALAMREMRRAAPEEGEAR